MQIQIAGQNLQLLPQRAVLLCDSHTLLVADAHFGKAAAFRARGVPVPRGTTAENLSLLTSLIAQHAVRELVFLGDFLHARESHAQATLDALLHWRKQHEALPMTLVRGNHDDRAGDPPDVLRFAVVNEPYTRGGFALCHHPQPHAAAYTLAGHLHPSVRLASGIDGARLPCFWFGASVGVLPAFGSFTGTHPIQPATGDRVIALADDRLIEMPVHLLQRAV
jgi:uncharacterized protein